MPDHLASFDQCCSYAERVARHEGQPQYVLRTGVATPPFLVMRHDMLVTAVDDDELINAIVFEAMPALAA